MQYNKDTRIQAGHGITILNAGEPYMNIIAIFKSSTVHTKQAQSITIVRANTNSSRSGNILQKPKSLLSKKKLPANHFRKHLGKN